MNHAFLLNVHNDSEQALRLVQFLHSKKRENSWLRFYLYFDGPKTNLAWDVMKQYADWAVVARCVPDKAVSINAALSTMAVQALHRGIEVATMLHSDIIPWNRDQFADFIVNFEKSGKAMTYCPMWPKHPYGSFIGPTFNLKKCFEMKILPVKLNAMSPEMKGYCNEGIFQNSLRSVVGWRDEVYPVWQVTQPYTGQLEDPAALKIGHSMDDKFFVFNDLVPESSILHVSDPRFWNQLDFFCRW